MLRQIAQTESRQGASGPLEGDQVHVRSTQLSDMRGPEPFIVGVERRDDVAVVQPRGELDVATVETLHAALDGIKGASRLVLDLRGLSFIDSTGLHSLVALHERARREGFALALVAPAPPVDKAIHLCGLDASLPFVAPADAVDP